jgi:hypothetical protein
MDWFNFYFKILFYFIHQKRTQTDTQFQLLGKIVENFNRVCDLFTVNLRAAHECQSISSELRTFHRYFANIGPMDANRNEIPLVSSINIQSQRIADIKTVLQRFSNINTNINLAVNNANNANNAVIKSESSGTP